ncbi:zf-RING_2 domain-containing protein [Cephalotus follicularis]|uniref:Zf-RING_2 domain-containing protein n=1 Tax=Cephalotus follicularis TaxID=3775 RepID=A0A1Q3DDY5_CEPFO|nr:zf-RING_2 domain-containing protein [Cephalotus follicularis]
MIVVVILVLIWCLRNVCVRYRQYLDSDDQTQEADIEAGSGRGTVTDKSLIVLQPLPTLVYHMSHEEGRETSGDCSICLEEFKDKDMLIILPHCNHMFHKLCIHQWLLRNQHCPLCRDFVHVRIA